MSARTLLNEIKLKGVRLWIEDGNIGYSGPKNTLTPEVLERMRKHKAGLLNLLQDEELRHGDIWNRGLDARYSYHKGYIKLHDPTTGEIHDFPKRDCFGSIIQDANAKLRNSKGGAA